VTRKSGYVERYEGLLREHRLLFTLDLIKEKLAESYRAGDEVEMAYMISDIMDICASTGNKHLHWFKRLLDNHFEGIYANATYTISAGKIEGIKGMIKTLRHQGYDYPYDDHFFLKLFEASRKTYVRNLGPNKIPQGF
jgi:transposase